MVIKLNIKKIKIHCISFKKRDVIVLSDSAENN